jgi:hypothetical protein
MRLLLRLPSRNNDAHGQATLRTSPPMFLKEDVVATPDLSATFATTCVVATPVLSVT